MKRFLDIIGALIGLLVTSPLMGGIAAAIWLRMGRPVIFTQVRPGKDAETFLIYKFRTMTDRRDGAGELLSDEERLTELGRILRSTSLDELPELLNVLKGDMSLVGPRPLLSEYLPLYDERQARRHEVRPGITGWAQVNGRNALSWEDKLEHDVWYVENRSLALDLKILAMTLWNVITRQGISADGHATAPRFIGTRQEDA